MVIKIFKISTKEMWTMSNKEALRDFIKQEIGIKPDSKLTIVRLIQYLPRENYYHVK
jgi:hypothetical protein